MPGILSQCGNQQKSSLKDLIEDPKKNEAVDDDSDDDVPELIGDFVTFEDSTTEKKEEEKKVTKEEHESKAKAADAEIPVVDGNLYIIKGPGWEEECKKVAMCFHKYGIVKMKDPRVTF